MKLYGTNPVINLVLFGVEEYWKCVGFLWLGREKGKGFFSHCAFVRLRGGRAKLERKGLRFGPAKRVRRGRIGVQGLHDFRRDFGNTCTRKVQFIGSIKAFTSFFVPIYSLLV